MYQLQPRLAGRGVIQDEEKIPVVSNLVSRRAENICLLVLWSYQCSAAQ